MSANAGFTTDRKRVDALGAFTLDELLVALRDRADLAGLRVDVYPAGAPNPDLELERQRVTDLTRERDAALAAKQDQQAAASAFRNDLIAARQRNRELADERVQHTGRIAELERALDGSYAEANDLRAKVAALEHKAGPDARDVDGLSQTASNLLKRNSDLKALADQARAEAAAQLAQATTLVNELAKVRDDLAAVVDERDGLERANAELRDALEGAEAIADELEALKREVGGPPAGADELVENTGNGEVRVTVPAVRFDGNDGEAPPAASPPEPPPAAPSSSPLVVEDLVGKWSSDRTPAARTNNSGLVLELLKRAYRADGLEGWLAPGHMAAALGVPPHRVSKLLNTLLADDTVDHNGLLRSASRFRLGARWRATLDRQADFERDPAGAADRHGQGVAPAGIEATLEDRGTVSREAAADFMANNQASHHVRTDDADEPDELEDLHARAEAGDVRAQARERARRRAARNEAIDQAAAAANAADRDAGRPSVEGRVLTEVARQPGTNDEIAGRLRDAGYAKRDVVAAMLKLRADGDLEDTGERRRGNKVYRATHPEFA